MSSLDRKMFRDLLQMPAQVLAISLVIACGLGVLMMAMGTHRFLKSTRDNYYQDYRFAEVFASLKRAPRTLGERLSELPGVATLDLRIVRLAVLDLEGVTEPLLGQFISLPSRTEPNLNRIHLKTGRMIDPLRLGEVLVTDAFAEANRLQLGDTVKAVINGRLQPLTIVGTALSPEYVFQIRPGTLLPDDSRFGIFWMSERELEMAYNMEGAFNSVSATVMKGYSEADVIEGLDRLLKPYGSTGAFGRNLQPSAKFLDQELTQLRAMSIVAPLIFFGVASFLLNVVLERLITMQREQIASLKAFGYSNWGVGIHYGKFVLVIAGLGSLFGAVSGEHLARSMSKMYSEFFRFPAAHFETDWRLVFFGIGVTVLTSILATLRPVIKAVSLPPAEAMRPAPPSNFGPTIAERFGFQKWLTTSAQMMLRELERRPIKSGMSILGIAMAVAVLVLGRFAVDGIAYILDFQFSLTQRYDVQLSLVEATSPGVRRELQQLPGVMSVETIRGASVRFHSGHRSRLSSLLALDEHRDLFRVMNTREKPVHIPPRGLVLGKKLAEILDARVGDTLRVEFLERRDLVEDIPVAVIFDELSGANAYIHRDHLHEILSETDVSSGAFLMVDELRQDELYRALKEMPRVAGVMVKKSVVESFRKTVSENQLRMQGINMVFACIIAFGVVFNTARISLAERSREFATLRVIGFTRWEVSKVLIGELFIMTLIAIPLGYVIGYGFCLALTIAFESENFRMPLVISFKTLGIAASVTLFAVVFACWSVQKQIQQLDMIGALKSKE